MDVFTVLTILVSATLILIFPLLWINSLYWDRGKIPPYYRYSRQHELEILIALSGIIVRQDFRDMAEKKTYLNDYFNRFYKNDNYDFTDSFKQSYTHPMKLESIAAWFNKHCKNDQHKLNIVQFLLSLAMIDGQLIRSEYVVIQKLHRILNLPDKEFDRLVSIFANSKKEERQTKTADHGSRELLRNYSILGLTPPVDAVVLKKTYRELVKTHHPDRLVNASPLQQKLAQERFIAIQQAYEYVEQHAG